jgi:acetoin utilization protein AcuB
MRVDEIMSTEVRTIGIDRTAEQASSEMRLRRIHHLVVVEQGRVVGVVSERDLRGMTERAGSFKTVGELMSPDVVVAKPKTTVRQAANLLRGRSIGCLPIMDNSRLMGIVTVTDLLEYIGEGTAHAFLETRWKPVRSIARNPRAVGSR